jgi:hypothetical protein
MAGIKSKLFKSHGLQKRLNTSEVSEKSVPVKKGSVKTRIENILQYFNYILRYKIGYILPKKYRPQTIIIIARKRSTCV